MPSVYPADFDPVRHVPMTTLVRLSTNEGANLDNDNDDDDDDDDDDNDEGDDEYPFSTRFIIWLCLIVV